MFCVTIAMVKSVLELVDQLLGSSNIIASGRSAIVRAMQRRCHWSPDRPIAEVF